MHAEKGDIECLGHRPGVTGGGKQHFQNGINTDDQVFRPE